MSSSTRPTGIATWNTQGNYSAQSKQSMLASRRTSVVMIQEGGVRQPTGQLGARYVTSGESVGAFNQRCTNYIQTPVEPDEVLIIENARGYAVIGGGEAGRLPLAVAIGKDLFISHHSIASKSNADTAELIRALQQNPAYRAYDRVIIGADFNSDPASIEALVDRIMEARGRHNFEHAEVISSGQTTHPSSGSELDYFVVLSSTPIDTSNTPTVRPATQGGHRVSDHDLTEMKLDC